MTYQAHNKPKYNLFSRIISLRNKSLPSYQNLCPKWLRRNAGASFKAGKGWKGLRTPSKIYDFSFFPVNRILKQCYCCKNNTLRRLKPQGSL